MAEARKGRYCKICHKSLHGDFYYTGRCAEHQTTQDSDIKLTADAVEAKRHGLSYGQLIAAKREGRL
jgi:hypothetical protein